MLSLPGFLVLLFQRPPLLLLLALDAETASICAGRSRSRVVDGDVHAISPSVSCRPPISGSSSWKRRSRVYSNARRVALLWLVCLEEGKSARGKFGEYAELDFCADDLSNDQVHSRVWRRRERHREGRYRCARDLTSSPPQSLFKPMLQPPLRACSSRRPVSRSRQSRLTPT